MEEMSSDALEDVNKNSSLYSVRSSIGKMENPFFSTALVNDKAVRILVIWVRMFRLLIAIFFPAL